MSHVLETGEEMGSGAQMEKVALQRSTIRGVKVNYRVGVKMWSWNLGKELFSLLQFSP